MSGRPVRRLARRQVVLPPAVFVVLTVACAALGLWARVNAMEQASAYPGPMPEMAPPADAGALHPPASPPPLHTEGNRVCGPDGRPVRLEGVNVASLEWANEGERVVESLGVAYDRWNCNLVRLPLSQDRWFGKAPGQADGGAKYRSIVDDAVAAAVKRGRYVILDLHWSDAGAWGEHIGQHKMPDGGSVLFWQSLASRYGNDSAVLMGLYNEPHDVTWDVWLRGGTVEETVRPRRQGDNAEGAQPVTVSYRAVGFQELYDATRAAGARDNLMSSAGSTGHTTWPASPAAAAPSRA